MVEIVCPCSNSCFETRIQIIFGNNEIIIEIDFLDRSIFDARRKGEDGKRDKVDLSRSLFRSLEPERTTKRQSAISLFSRVLGRYCDIYREDRKIRKPLRDRLWLTMCRRSLRWGERAATLEDFVLRTVTRLPSFADRILGIVFDLTNRYSSPGCLLFFLNVPHNMFLTRSRTPLYSFIQHEKKCREREREREKKRKK